MSKLVSPHPSIWVNILGPSGDDKLRHLEPYSLLKTKGQSILEHNYFEWAILLAVVHLGLTFDIDEYIDQINLNKFKPYSAKRFCWTMFKCDVLSWRLLTSNNETLIVGNLGKSS